PIQVVAVHVPPSLDRLELVARTGPNSVRIDDGDRWSAPLADMARSVLAQDLAARLPAGAVVMPDAPMPPGTQRLVVTMAQFGLDADGAARLVASWSLLTGDDDTVALRRQVALTAAPAQSGAAGDAAAMSALLGQLADRVVDALPSHG